jgi:hypothetical protein
MDMAFVNRLRPHAVGAALTLAVATLIVLAAATEAKTPDAHLNGSKAVAPKSAPDVVKDMIRAGNKIRHKRYKWGGGHGSWNDKGYDCSGAVSYVLHKSGILDYPLDSKGFMKWGGKRKGKWVSIFASKEHVYMIVAGLRFDTSYITDGDKSGPGWSEYMRPSKGFRTRHPKGL